MVESYKRIQYAGFSDFLLQASINALILSLATVVTILIGFFIVSAARFSKHNWFSRIASLGYAIPGTVLAIGLMLALGKIDHAIADFLHLS